MKFWSISRHPRAGGRLAVAGVMLLLWSARSPHGIPELHHLLHRDSQAPDHNCPVTQIQQHPLLVGFAAITAPVPALVVVAAVCHAEVQFLPPPTTAVSQPRATFPFLFPNGCWLEPG